MKTLFILLTISLTRSDPVSLKEDERLYSQTFNSPFGNFNEIKLNFGNSGKDLSQKFTPIFGYSDSIVGDQTTAKWGIKCTKEINCTTDDKKTGEKYIYNSHYTYKSASLPLRLTLDDFNDKNKSVEVQFVQGGNKWPLVNRHVLGLSP